MMTMMTPRYAKAGSPKKFFSFAPLAKLYLHFQDRGAAHRPIR